MHFISRIYVASALLLAVSAAPLVPVPSTMASLDGSAPSSRSDFDTFSSVTLTAPGGPNEIVPSRQSDTSGCGVGFSIPTVMILVFGLPSGSYLEGDRFDAEASKKTRRVIEDNGDTYGWDDSKERSSCSKFLWFYYPMTIVYSQPSNVSRSVHAVICPTREEYEPTNAYIYMSPELDVVRTTVSVHSFPLNYAALPSCTNVERASSVYTLSPSIPFPFEAFNVWICFGYVREVQQGIGAARFLESFGF
ncbi:hypothetical protein C8R43DRAFT_1211052 [Mycena crocata]|nr:hypothetical protein C8R43DRAFT_1211052 [Mycena crocata]